jgi:hypothetical protein
MAPLPDGLTFEDIDLTQVDKKSPVDDVLMESIAEDIYYLKAQLASSGTGVFDFKVNGNLGVLANVLPFRRIDSAFVSKGQTLANSALFLEIPGTGGTLEVDVRKYRATDTPILDITNVYSQNINSITRAGSAGSTQSIAKATPQVNTQSIAFWKTQVNVSSIIYLGQNLWRYNLAAAIDTDWVEGTDYVTFASCTSGGNNGTFLIVRKNDDSLDNIVVYNSSGVAQTGAAGTVDLQALKYTLTNPATAEFVVGEDARFASHTSALNDGDFPIYAVNSGGNNVVIKNQVGIAQGGVAGTTDALRWKYTLGATASTDLIVGEDGLFASHTSSVNDGNLPITAVSGSTVTVYNTAGATQGGVAGTVNSNRWIYALPTDPTSSFSVGHEFVATSATTAANNGTFSVVQINRSASNNLVVYNTAGVTQAGAVGTLTHTRRILKFSADLSTIYSTASRVYITGTPDANYSSDEFDVLEVNRGGGANFNIVIDYSTGLTQASPAGRISFESRSVFSTRPSITVNRDMRSVTTGVLDSTEKTIAAGRMICMEILQIPTGAPENMSAQVS